MIHSYGFDLFTPQGIQRDGGKWWIGSKFISHLRKFSFFKYWKFFRSFTQWIFIILIHLNSSKFYLPFLPKIHYAYQLLFILSALLPLKMISSDYNVITSYLSFFRRPLHTLSFSFWKTCRLFFTNYSNKCIYTYKHTYMYIQTFRL